MGKNRIFDLKKQGFLKVIFTMESLPKYLL